MENLSPPAQNSNLSTPPPSNESSIGAQSYHHEWSSPETAETISCRAQRSLAANSESFPSSSADNHSTETTSCALLPCQPYDPHQLSIVGSSDNDLRETLPTISHREDAIRTVRFANQSLTKTLDGLLQTTKEYFPQSLMVRFVELPALKEFSECVDQLIVTLGHLEQALRDPRNYTDMSEIAHMTSQIRLFLNGIIGDARSLLRFWTHREQGQKQGEPLKGKDLRLRRIAIHDSNLNLERLAAMSKVADRHIRLLTRGYPEPPKSGVKVWLEGLRQRLQWSRREGAGCKHNETVCE